MVFFFVLFFVCVCVCVCLLALGWTTVKYGFPESEFHKLQQVQNSLDVLMNL